MVKAAARPSSVSPPRLFQPATIAIRLAMARTTAAMAPTVTAVGRSTARERLERCAGGLVLRAAARVAARRGCRGAAAGAGARSREGGRLRTRTRLRFWPLTTLRQPGSPPARRAARGRGARDRRRRGSLAPPRCAGACCITVADVIEVDPADREPRDARRRARRRAPRTTAPPRAGPASWASPTRARRSVVGDRPSAASSCSSECVESPISTSAPTAPRAPLATGMSSWPTCTPSAPQRHGEVGPVVQPEQRIVLVAQRAGSTAAARTSSSSLADLVAELDHVHAARERRREQLVEAGPYIGDEVQPRPREPLAAGIHYGLNARVLSWLRTVLYAGRAVPSDRSSPASKRLSPDDCFQW